MDIRIVNSELKTNASQNLEIEEDLKKADASLKETLKIYEQENQEK